MDTQATVRRHDRGLSALGCTQSLSHGPHHQHDVASQRPQAARLPRAVSVSWPKGWHADGATDGPMFAGIEMYSAPGEALVNGMAAVVEPDEEHLLPDTIRRLLPQRSFDGVPAVGYAFTDGADEVAQTDWEYRIELEGDQAFKILLSAPARELPRWEATFNQILDSVTVR